MKDPHPNPSTHRFAVSSEYRERGKDAAMFALPNQSLPEAYVHEARKTLRDAHATIVHCLEQLDDEQVNWRPFEQQNSAANLVLHLCGNVRQWIIAGVGGKPDTRERAREFSDRTKYSRDDLLERLAKTVR